MSAQTQAIEQAIDFLTTPLSRTTVSGSAISVLQAHLFASLNSLSTRSPNRTIGLRLASSTPPPECISRACEASGVNWGEWMFLIGGGMGLDLDISIQPTAVTASFSRAGTPSLGLVTVWQQEERQMMSTRELLYADDDSEDLFNEIHRSQNSPSWLSTWGPSKQPYKPSALSQPVAVPKLGPVPSGARSSHSSHSRSSSYASTTSSHSHHSHHSASYYPNQANANVNPEFGYPHAVERPGSSNSSNASGSPRGSVYSLSEDGSSGSSGALSWTRRGTVVPGPQQTAIMAARQAHAQAQAHGQPQMKGVHPGYMPTGPVTEVQLPPFGIKHQQPQGQQQQQQSRHHRTSPSGSTCSVSSTASGHSGNGSANGSNGNKHRRQRSQTTNVVIDPTKANVTAYDGGKTKVMTGGVMLGSVSGGSKRKGF